MAEILHQLIGSLSHYLQGFICPRWCRISAINSSALFGLVIQWALFILAWSIWGHTCHSSSAYLSCTCCTGQAGWMFGVSKQNYGGFDSLYSNGSLKNYQPYTCICCRFTPPKTNMEGPKWWALEKATGPFKNGVIFGIDMLDFWSVVNSFHHQTFEIWRHLTIIVLQGIPNWLVQNHQQYWYQSLEPWFASKKQWFSSLQDVDADELDHVAGQVGSKNLGLHRAGCRACLDIGTSRWNFCRKWRHCTWHILGDRLISLAPLSWSWDFTCNPLKV